MPIFLHGMVEEGVEALGLRLLEGRLRKKERRRRENALYSNQMRADIAFRCHSILLRL